MFKNTRPSDEKLVEEEKLRAAKFAAKSKADTDGRYGKPPVAKPAPAAVKPAPAPAAKTSIRAAQA